jgi:emfourin
MSAPVRLGFRRSGGLAGITIGVDTDTDELSPAEGELIRALLADPGRPPSSAPGVPDRFTYELLIDDGQHRRLVRWPESAVPDDARPLIDELTTRSRPIA